MGKFFNILLLLLFFVYFYLVINHYISQENTKIIELNRSEIDNIISKKIIDVPLLKNDTESVIEFNSTFSEIIKDDQPRKFWDLLIKK
tara:strand:- start:44 stop:307 length:264 start_codon:yes stop_codon:yes gene_type:complete